MWQGHGDQEARLAASEHGPGGLGFGRCLPAPPPSELPRSLFLPPVTARGLSFHTCDCSLEIAAPLAPAAWEPSRGSLFSPDLPGLRGQGEALGWRGEAGQSSLPPSVLAGMGLAGHHRVNSPSGRGPLTLPSPRLTFPLSPPPPLLCPHNGPSPSPSSARTAERAARPEMRRKAKGHPHPPKS